MKLHDKSVDRSAVVVGLFVLSVSSICSHLFAAAGTFDDHVIAACRGAEGLCIHIPCTDGRLESELGRAGRLLVQGLAVDDASAAKTIAAITDCGLYPLASVEKVRDPRRLAFADNLVNLLIVDLDALGGRAPAMSEIQRVLCPNGVAYLWQNGRVKKITKPRPEDTDDWTHFDYGPDGNAVSHDRRVKPPTQIQWCSGVQPIKLGGNPAGFVGSMGFRLAGGRAFSDWTRQDANGRNKQACFGAWDAYNGVPLWSTTKKYKGGQRPMHIAADGRRVYMFTVPGEPLAALDAATGKVAMRYDKAGVMPGNTGMASFRLCKGRLVVANKETLYVLDEKTGDILWRYQDRPGNVLLFPTVSSDLDRVFVLASDFTEDEKIQKRWPNARSIAVVCLKFSDGSVVWRNTEVAGKHIGQMTAHGNYVGLFGGGGIGAGRNPFTGCIRLSDGKLLWTGTFPTEWNRAGYTFLWRDDTMYYADPWKIFRLDPETGRETHMYGSSYNNRCMRFSATDDWFIHGLVSYVDKDFNGIVQSVARSACANSVFPANGMVYFTPTACGCTTMLRGHICLSSEPLREPVADALRLDNSPMKHRSGGAGKSFVLPESIIASQWSRQGRGVLEETPPVESGNRTFVALVHLHQVQCRGRASRALWTFTAAGRVSSAPVIVDGLCVFGSHDGRVYALNAADGSLMWRFMAAPSERKIVSCGQLESAWPVYGVVLHKGLIYASAGLHAESGGGIYVWGLEPTTGRIVHKALLSKSQPLIAGTSRDQSRVVPHSALNGPLKTDGDSLYLPAGINRRFVFKTTMTPEELTKKLHTKPARKK